MLDFSVKFKVEFTMETVGLSWRFTNVLWRYKIISKVDIFRNRKAESTIEFFGLVHNGDF